MDAHAFDGLTRRAAAAVSRRASLVALGGAAVIAGLLAPTTPEVRAVKGKKKKQKCQKQRGQCQEAVEDFCLSAAAAAASVTVEGSQCQAQLLQCCGFFTSCNARDGVECLLEELLELVVD